MNWYSAQGWCVAQGMSTPTRGTLGCNWLNVETFCKSDILDGLAAGFGNKGYHWLEQAGSSVSAFTIKIHTDHRVNGDWFGNSNYALCH